jgi:2'-hydroxyisoflavone reductase
VLDLPVNVDPKQILVLGGTRFLGRAIAESALSSGHEVTLFNRGLTNPDLFADAEKLRGDRTADLSALNGRHWDAVIDVACYEPSVVQRSIEALRDAVARYVFVSTLSVYADHSTTEAQREDAPVLALGSSDDPGVLYGARKAACETEVLSAFSGRATIARAGLIVGPHDPTNRFVCWPRRVAVGGRILAPGDPKDPLQFIDVRDLARWLVMAASTEVPGVFNVTGRPIEFGAFLDHCSVSGVGAEITWVSSEHLLEAGLDPWMGVSLWVGAKGWEAANAVDVARAIATGIRYRPIAQSIEGALEFPSADDSMPLDPALERDLLQRFAPQS